MANQFLSLSLFLMLLSFFIVMNSISSFEEVKTRPVIRSLAIAFASNNKTDDISAVQPDPAQALREGGVLGKVEALFRSQLADYEVARNRFGTTMHIRLPMRDFERAILSGQQREYKEGQVFSGVGGFFRPTLVSVLTSAADGVPFRMDMVMNIGGNPADLQNTNPQAVAAELRRISVLAQRLEEAGMPRKLVSAGLGAGREGFVDLFFRIHEPFNPLGAEVPVEGGETGLSGEVSGEAPP